MDTVSIGSTPKFQMICKEPTQRVGIQLVLVIDCICSVCFDKSTVCSVFSYEHLYLHKQLSRYMVVGVTRGVVGLTQGVVGLTRCVVGLARGVVGLT